MLTRRAQAYCAVSSITVELSIQYNLKLTLVIYTLSINFWLFFMFFIGFGYASDSKH